MITANLPILMPVILLSGALMTALLGSWRDRLAFPSALISVVLAFAAALTGIRHVVLEGPLRYVVGGWIRLMGIELVLDPLSAFMSAVILGVGAIVIAHSRLVVRLEIKSGGGAFYGVSLLLLAGFTGIVLTGDLFNLYVFLEISSLAGYALIAVGDKPSPVAAFRYLLLGTIGASFYLLGIGFLYLMVGSLNMVDVASVASSMLGEPPMVVGLVLIVLGIGIKMAIFPLHAWLPDAYTHAGSTSSALIAPLGTKVGAYILVRILFFVFDAGIVNDLLPIMDILVLLSIGGILFGSVMAIAQKELKRMLAYSSIAQIGYIGLGIGLASPLGVIGAMLHVLNHALMKSSLFLVAANLRMRVGHSDIAQFNHGLTKLMPWTMAGFTVAALSMVGLPPLAGFFSKWYLVLAAVDASNWFAVAVVLFGSLLTAVYFFRVLETLYIKGKKEGDTAVEASHATPERLTSSLVLPIALLSLLLFAAGVFNAVIVNDVLSQIIPGR